MTAGSSTFQTFCTVTLPLMRPAMVSVLLINFIRGIEAFEVPALIGVPAKISVFTTKIFLAIHQFPSDFGLAGAYAVTLLAISTVGVLDLRQDHPKRRALRDGDRQGLSSARDRSGQLEVAHAWHLVLNIFSRGHSADIRPALVVVYSLLRRAILGTGGENDLGQLSIYSQLSAGGDGVQE